MYILAQIILLLYKMSHTSSFQDTKLTDKKKSKPLHSWLLPDFGKN